MPKDGAEALKLCAAAPAGWLVVGSAPWANAAAAANTWHVKHIWSRRCVLIELCQCVRAIHTSTLRRERTSPGCEIFGIKGQLQEAWLRRPTRGKPSHGCAHHQNTPLRSCRPDVAGAWLDRHWWQPV
eukprot:5744447-Amphidinium_carterae.2